MSFALFSSLRICLLIAVLLFRTGCAAPNQMGSPVSTGGSSGSFGQTRYVDASGSDSNDGSEQRPWATIQHAADLVNPGDSVIVRDGVYREAVIIKRGGFPGAMVTFRAEHKWGARVSPDATPDGWSIAIATGVDYVTIQDFEITGQPDTAWGIKVNGNHSKILGNKLHDIGTSRDQCVSGGAILVGGDYANNDTELNGNSIYNIGSPRTAGFRCNKMHGIYLTNRGGLVANNTIAQVWQGFGIHLYGEVANWNITSNTVSDSGDNGHSTGGAYYISCGPNVFACDYIAVTNNTFADTQNSCIWQDPGPGRLGPHNSYVGNVTRNCGPNHWD